MTLSRRQRQTVQALGDTLFPSLGDSDPSGGEILPDAMDRFIADLAPEQQKGLGTALGLFDIGAVLTRARRFHKLSPGAREAYVRRWQTSRLAVRKIIYRALRDTMAMVYYQDERTWPTIGYAGPAVSRERQP